MFNLSGNTKIVSKEYSKPVENAIHILSRDMSKVFFESTYDTNYIQLLRDETVEEERFIIHVEEEIRILAKDDLGFIYGILYISEKFLGIKPFWFWMDQTITQRDKVHIAYGRYESDEPKVRYRGWFFNDEVLLMKWKINGDSKEVWRMAYEALLRCGGNMTIPGTDKMARQNSQMAADMGLWITHHHAEPLGAEMFKRAYPEAEPNIIEHMDLFLGLWEEAVIRQKVYKVIWNLGFRGQGDKPFWSDDQSNQFDTPQKRGELISQIIEKQYELVKKYVQHPVCCTNLYGEVMELYEAGYIHLSPEIIKVRADNGYGKMVTRRRDNHSARVSAMPDPLDRGKQGIYYHVSFYDLQAANHITMLPNSVEFVDRELSEVLDRGGDDFWIINCSNVRPHVYYLDAVRKKWYQNIISDEEHSKAFAADYYNGDTEIAKCLEAFPKSMIAYGSHEDEHVGEQFYTENIRMIAHQLICDRTQNVAGLYWLTGNVPLREQVQKMYDLVNDGMTQLNELYKMCESVSRKLEGTKKRLFDSTILLQAIIHLNCATGVLLFAKGYEEYATGAYKNAFILFGKSEESYQEAHQMMRETEYDVWKDFYGNDCFADIKHTAYMIRKVMGLVRELGDNARHDKWYRETLYAPQDRDIFLLLVTDNHMTDWELYEAMKTHEEETKGE